MRVNRSVDKDGGSSRPLVIGLGGGRVSTLPSPNSEISCPDTIPPAIPPSRTAGSHQGHLTVLLCNRISYPRKLVRFLAWARLATQSLVAPDWPEGHEKSWPYTFGFVFSKTPKSISTHHLTTSPPTPLPRSSYSQHRPT